MRRGHISQAETDVVLLKHSLCPITRAHKRAGYDLQETARQTPVSKALEFLRRDKALNREMVPGG